MRTLKVLSLVLALVLCFGLVGTAFAAPANYKGYTDAEQIGDAYVEAADVMKGIGVIEGKTETTVDPTGSFTREQAAKIVAYMVLGKTAAEKLAATAAPFADVAANRWSAGFIAFCAEQGIISGYGDGKFGPADKLTGYQFAKMLLGAVGYNANGEYEGASWSINVAKDAIQQGVFEGDLAAATNQPIQRQQAMLMAFNGLFKGEPVSVTSTKYITDKGIHNDWAGAAAAIEKNGAKYIGSATITETKMKGSLADDVFGLTKVSTPTSDANGRVTKTYVADGKPVAVFEIAPAKVYSTAVTGGTIYSDLGLTKAPTVTFTVDKADDATPVVIASGNKTQIPGTGNGVELNVYYDAANNVVNLVLVNYYVGTVSAVDSMGVVTVKGGAPINGLTLKVAGLKKDDVVLATVDKSGTTKLATLEKVEATSVTPNRYTANDFIAGGVTYKYSANAVCAAYADTKFGATNIVLDKFGYVIDRPASFTAPTPIEYAVFLSSTTDAKVWPATEDTYRAQIVKADGSVAIVATDKDYQKTAGFVAGDVVVCKAGTLADTGKTLFTKAAAFESGSNVVITKNTVKFGTAAKANDKTVFLLNTKDANGNFTVYTPYTGIGNVPSTKSPATNKYTVVNNKDGFAEFVFVSGAVLDVPSTAAKTVTFVDYSSGKTVVDADKGEFTTYNAVVDGKITTIEVVAKTDPFKTVGKDAIWSDMTTKDGLVTAATKMSGFVSGSKTEAAAIGVIGLNGDYFTYNDATQVYMISASGIKSIAVADIKTDANDEVVYLVKDGVLTAAFITAVA